MEYRTYAGKSWFDPRLEQQLTTVQLAQDGSKHLLGVLLGAPYLFVLVNPLAGNRVAPDEHPHQETVVPWQDMPA